MIELSAATSLFLPYLMIVNVLSFVVYGIDKLKAKRGKWRISETSLLLLALMGGSVGAWAGIRVWHHKTLHKKNQIRNSLHILCPSGNGSLHAQCCMILPYPGAVYRYLQRNCL